MWVQPTLTETLLVICVMEFVVVLAAIAACHNQRKKMEELDKTIVYQIKLNQELARTNNELRNPKLPS